MSTPDPDTIGRSRPCPWCSATMHLPFGGPGVIVRAIRDTGDVNVKDSGWTYTPYTCCCKQRGAAPEPAAASEWAF